LSLCADFNHYDLLLFAFSEQQHPQLCSLCRDPTSCSASDGYSGETGAVRCLVEGDGDVAFTSVSAVNSYFDAHPRKSRDDYLLLCLDGSSELIGADSCDWGTRPGNAFVIRKGKGSAHFLVKSSCSD
jgi:hypothetical protein